MALAIAVGDPISRTRVVGGLALVALVVVIVVHLVRRREARRWVLPVRFGSVRSSNSGYYRKARTSDIEDGDGTYLPSWRPSLLHQKMLPGPSLPSSWSDLRSRLGLSSASLSHRADPDRYRDVEDTEIEMADDGDEMSLPTNGATVSHGHRTRSTLSGSSRSMTTGGAIEGEALPSLPPSQSTPTPPGLPSKRVSPAVTARRASLPITPISPSDSNMSPSSFSSNRNTAMHPFVRPLPTPPTMSGSGASQMTPSAMAFSPLSPVSPANLARNASYARSRGMDPVPEDADADASEYAETRSLRQLPSPPASPDQDHVDARRRGSSVSSSRRPSLAGRQSAPNALPSSYRPRSSTGPSVGLPLTAAFQTSVLRTGSGASSSSIAPSRSSFAHGQRYPSITTSSPPPRSRPSSASVSSMSSVMAAARASPSPSPAPDTNDVMARPTEAFRRMSTTDIRQRHPRASSSRPDSPNAEGQARAFLRTSDALGMPQVYETTTSGTSSRPSSSHRHAVVYNPPPPGTGISGGAPPSSFASSRPLPLTPTSPPALSPIATPAASSSAPRLSVHTNPRAPGTGSAQPSAVNWKSLASGSRTSLASTHHSSSQTPLPRSRSNSVRSVRTLPSHLPPLDPLPPLSIGLKGSSEEDNEDDLRAQGRKR
ncbi:hypothetical protein DICSQDRAFT_183109 [Dichomitus squalens LYAD-421 SS1]|uniref:Uncharacterized protein n=1 Tax=Dichomitus squalens (strain LYAD-421) TaxID=732165 RepID=R7SN88_DICSQ|nr:uncharacterized protein DICSQDRAFT_183109 [Dichomitus squalens LYAD-421 SS1]EJF57581.1 hypothetical protein DICSQDRAFT_183109 [Dichomitus squalens LYAD-421 SS1]